MDDQNEVFANALEAEFNLESARLEDAPNFLAFLVRKYFREKPWTFLREEFIDDPLINVWDVNLMWDMLSPNWAAAEMNAIKEWRESHHTIRVLFDQYNMNAYVDLRSNQPISVEVARFMAAANEEIDAILEAWYFSDLDDGSDEDQSDLESSAG